MGNNVASQGLSEAAFISEVFHNLSQPLTALNCTLDLALQNDRTYEQLRASVQSALDHAERLRQRLLLVRALNDACEPGEPAPPTDLPALLRDLEEDLSPVFESAGRSFVLRTRCGPLLVPAERMRLMRCLLVLLEYLLVYLAEGETLGLTVVRRAAHQAEIRIEGAFSLPIGPLDDGHLHSCEIELTRRTFAAAGGEFALDRATADRGVCVGTLPLV
jgi:signal transduction histidine kinase